MDLEVSGSPMVPGPQQRAETLTKEGSFCSIGFAITKALVALVAMISY